MTPLSTPAAQGTVAGWKLVPVEPTEAMLDAYWEQTGESKEMRPRTHAYMRRYWSAMLSAVRVPMADTEAVKRIADLLDENAECYSENAMDRAFLGNSEELAALIIEVQALSASPSPEALPASGVRVKPLEWIEYPGDQFCRTFWQAKGFGGHYVVEVRHSGDFDMWLPETSSGQRFATLEEARAAALADYEHRILSALASDATPAPTSGSEDGGFVTITTNGTTRTIPADEPVFLIRGQDVIGGAAVRAWATLAEASGADFDMCQIAREHAAKMDAWPKKKVADLPKQEDGR